MQSNHIRFFSMLMMFSMFCSACGQNAVTATVTADTSKPGPCTEVGQRWTSPIDGVALVCVRRAIF